MQIQNENSNTVAVGSSSTSLPYRNFYGGASYPFLQWHNPVPEKDYFYSINLKETQDKEVQKNKSMIRSNTGSGNASEDLETQTGGTGDGDRRWDEETQSGKNESVSTLEFVFKPIDELAAPDHGKVKVKCLKGFAPYKRRKAESNCSKLMVKMRENRGCDYVHSEYITFLRRFLTCRISDSVGCSHQL